MHTRNQRHTHVIGESESHTRDQGVGDTHTPDQGVGVAHMSKGVGVTQRVIGESEKQAHEESESHTHTRSRSRSHTHVIKGVGETCTPRVGDTHAIRDVGKTHGLSAFEFSLSRARQNVTSTLPNDPTTASCEQASVSHTTHTKGESA